MIKLKSDTFLGQLNELREIQNKELAGVKPHPDWTMEDSGWLDIEIREREATAHAVLQPFIDHAKKELGIE